MSLRDQSLNRWDHAIGFALCAAYVCVLLATAPAIGMSRDESMYTHAGDAYAGWIELAWREPSAAFQQEAIDAAFRVNREHPPLFKLLFGLGHLAQQRWQLFANESTSYRFAGMLSAGLLLWVIFAFGTRLWGRAAGVFAALAYALLPRPFYHAHLNAFDVPITLANTVVVYAYFRALTSRHWALGCGALFGLALLTKHNSWIVPGIFGIHFALVSYWQRRRVAQGAARELSRTPYALIACLTLGPLLFVACWPFLWHDTLRRIGWYVGFHFHHEYYNMEYFGVNYFWPPFPMSYSWVMTLFTVPLTTLALGLGGLADQLYASYRGLVAAWNAPQLAADGGNDVDPRLPALLIAGALFAPLVQITLPSTPIFGGTKHWFPAYPFLALCAGLAFTRVIDLARERLPRLPRAGVPIAAGAWLLAPAFVETAHSHPFGLSHYTVAAGGVPGAAEHGMNRQFWGFTTRSLVPYLREVLPNGGTVFICDMTYAAFGMLVRDGFLPENIRPTYDIAQADYAIVHHEKHFAEIDHQIWNVYGSVQPAHVLTYDGVPIISVYRNPRR